MTIEELNKSAIGWYLTDFVLLLNKYGYSTLRIKREENSDMIIKNVSLSQEDPYIINITC